MSLFLKGFVNNSYFNSVLAVLNRIGLVDLAGTKSCTLFLITKYVFFIVESMGLNQIL